MKRFVLFVPLVGVLALVVLFFLTLDRENKDALPSPLIGQAFPAFDMVALESGAAVTAEDLKGQKLLVNVWATWCPTCKAEHAFLNKLADQQGIRIIGINYKDEDIKARQWLESFGNPYELNVSDPDGKLGLELGVYGAPETFLVDANGVIRGKHIGDLNTEVWKKLQPQFEAMP